MRGPRNPLIVGSPSIDWDIGITIDNSGPEPIYEVAGTWMDTRRPNSTSIDSLCLPLNRAMDRARQETCSNSCRATEIFVS
jgi:hypothetical protein